MLQSCNKLVKQYWQLPCRPTTAVSIHRPQLQTSHPHTTNASPLVLDFTDHKQAFKKKTLWDVVRSLLVLAVCSSNAFSNNSAKIFEVAQRWLGASICSALVKPLFYNQFVGGVTLSDVRQSVEKMANVGIGTFVLMVMESIDKSEDAQQNQRKIISTMQGLSEKTTPYDSYMQVRLSALFPENLLKELSKLDIESRERLIHGAAAYMETRDPESLIWLRSIDAPTVPDLVTELMHCLQLLEEIGQNCVATDTVVMVDAEYISTNPALTSMALALSLRCNIDKPLVWNTTQCYLKSSFESIQWEYNFATKNNIHYGAKLVRGAYMVPETKAAAIGAYPSPVHDGIQATSESYNLIVDWLMLNILQGGRQGRKIRFVLASHNQDSIRKAIEKMDVYGIKTEDKKVIFAQTYGMADHITYTLSQAGYPVHKSLAVGSVGESLPYLSRRSQENTSIIANSRQERQLLKAELLHRIKGGRSSRIYGG